MNHTNPSATTTDFDHLLEEHVAMTRQYGEAQQRCSRVLQTQQQQIDRLKAEVMTLRAAVIIRDTALNYAYEDRAQLEASIPDLPKRVALVRHVEMLAARVQTLLRERGLWQWRRQPAVQATAVPSEPSTPLDASGEDLAATLVAADLVICQTGCLSHGDYWRVQDHCKRTGKACVITTEPGELRIVRLHKADAHSEDDKAWVAEPTVSS